MPKPEEEKVSLAFDAKSKARALEAQAQRFHAMANEGFSNKPSDIRKRFENPTASASSEDYRLLRSQIEASERAKKQLLGEREKLINAHMVSLKRSNNQLSDLEAVLPAFKNDPSYAEYTIKKQATASQREVLENSLNQNPSLESSAIQQAIQEIGEGYAACYTLLRQFLSLHAQALHINLQGAHIEGSAGAKIQTLVIQTEKGLQNVMDEIKQIGALEAALKEKDKLLIAKDAQITQLKEKEAADKESASFAIDMQKKAQAKAAAQNNFKLQDALIKACEEGDALQVKKLLEDGADPTEPGTTGIHPLGAAVWGMNPEVVNTLLEEMKDESPMTWEECKTHNEQYYKEVFMFSTFAPKTYREWHDLLIKMNRSCYVRGLHLAEADKIWHDEETSSWENFVSWVRRSSAWRGDITKGWERVRVMGIIWYGGGERIIQNSFDVFVGLSAELERSVNRAVSGKSSPSKVKDRI